MILNLICHACGKANLQKTAGDELHSTLRGKDVYILRRGETLTCSHCKNAHWPGIEMEVAAQAQDVDPIADACAAFADILAAEWAQTDAAATTSADRLVARIQQTPLIERLQKVDRIIGAVARDGKQMRMSIPPQSDDDDLVASQTLFDATCRIIELEHEAAGLRLALAQSRAARIEADGREREARAQADRLIADTRKTQRATRERADQAEADRDEARATLRDVMIAIAQYRRFEETPGDAIRRLCAEIADLRIRSTAAQEGKGGHVKA